MFAWYRYKEPMSTCRCMCKCRCRWGVRSEARQERAAFYYRLRTCKEASIYTPATLRKIAINQVRQSTGCARHHEQCRYLIFSYGTTICASRQALT